MNQQRRRGISPHRYTVREEIRQLALQGKTDAEIADRTHAAPATIQKTRLIYGIPSTKLKTDKQLLHAVALIITTSMTFTEVSARTEICLSTVSNISKEMRRLGVPFPPRTAGRPRKQ